MGDRSGVQGNDSSTGGKEVKKKSLKLLWQSTQMQVAYLFNYAGSPWLTQYWAREVIETKVYSGCFALFGLQW